MLLGLLFFLKNCSFVIFYSFVQILWFSPYFCEKCGILIWLELNVYITLVKILSQLGERLAFQITDMVRQALCLWAPSPIHILII
jgi:hypothetical protein